MHHLHGQAGVPMHQRGSTAIDGIFLSPSLLEDVQGGFLNFGEVTISNHRAVWLDLPAVLLGLEGQPQVTRPAGRRLKCSDPRIVSKYNTYLEHSIQDHQMVRKIQQVYETGVSALTLHQSEQYNAIDRQYVEEWAAAERQCRKFHVGKIPWMPTLTQAIYRVLYWKGIRKQLTGGWIATTVLHQRATRGQLEYKADHLLLGQAETTKQIKEAVQDYLLIKKQADRRDIWLGQLIEAQAAASGTTKKSRWKKIWMTEAIRKKARNVKRALGQLATRHGLTQVTAPIEGPGGRRITYMAKEQIKLACLDEAHQRFTQAVDMPILQQPLVTSISHADIDSRAFQQILDGTFQYPSTCEPITK